MRYLIARIFNLDLVSISFGFGNYRRFVRTGADGEKYVRVYGFDLHLKDRQHFFIHKKP